MMTAFDSIAARLHVQQWTLDYYWAGMAALILYRIVTKGWSKDTPKLVVPALLYSWLIAELFESIARSLVGSHQEQGTASLDTAMGFAFFLSTLTCRDYPREVQWGALGLFVLIVWASLNVQVSHMTDLVVGATIGSLGTGIAALLRAKQATPYAFGPLLAFRRYELFLMRYAFPAEVIAEERRLADHLTVLDLGCGDGVIKKLCPSARIAWHGVDVDPVRVRQCEALAYRMHSLNLERDSLPYADGTFDVVVLCHCLEHLTDPAEVLREADRVCRNGGSILIGIPIKLPLLAWVAQASYRYRVRTKGRKRGDTCQFFTINRLRSFLRRTLPHYEIDDLRGFRLFSSRETLPLENWFWYFRLNGWVGRHLPAITAEVNVVLRKREPLPTLEHQALDGGDWREALVAVEGIEPPTRGL